MDTLHSKNLISITMPVFQGEPFLEKTLQSIIRQDVEDWELLAVNDHSTDYSKDILMAYAAKDARIKALDNPDRGLIPALRHAYAHSSGSLITRMDQDDLMPPGKLRLLRNELEKRGRGHVVTGKIRYFSEGELGDGYRKYEQWLNAALSRANPWAEIYRECVLPSPNWMVHREDLDRAGAFDSELYPEDYDLCFRFYAAGLRLVVADEVTHLWRDHPDRASRTQMRYADPTYFSLKVKRWKGLEHRPDRPVVLWGAGPKGKRLAERLQEAGIDFFWVCDSPSKIGHMIKGVEMRPVAFAETLDRPCWLIAVSSPAGRADIQAWLDARKRILADDYFFFC